MDGNTEPTLNSRNFKLVKCPTCEKYPNRYGVTQIKPTIKFNGFRWNIEKGTWELQGYCVLCHKEWRILISMEPIRDLKFIIENPKLGGGQKVIGPIENHLRRCL